MNETDLNGIQNSLENELSELALSIQDEKEQVKKDWETNLDELDLSEFRFHQEISIKRLDRMELRFTQIVAALRHLKEGAYGICAMCEQEIQVERLKVLPWAMYCVDCQKRQESFQ